MKVDVHHAPARPDLPRLPGGHAARLLQREQRDVLACSAPASRGTSSTAPASPASATSTSADHQRREHRACRSSKAYQGQPKQIAAALWGNSAAQYRYKHVIVVDDDIDAGVLRADRLGAGPPRERRRGRAGGLPRHLRLAHRSQHADGGPRRGAARHRPLEPRAHRRHALVEVRAPPGVGRRALPADRAPGAATTRRGCASAGPSTGWVTSR